MKNQCPLCDGKKIEGTTTYTVDLGFGVVVVRAVPAKICSQCGEEWIDASVARSLETIVVSAKAKHSLVEVVGYSIK
jgi:YgiT-type zinc finger domain-containing protein